MGLQQEYSDEFERLWGPYPKWPVGRSKKKPSYATFLKVKKALKFMAADIDHIALDIETRVLTCLTWQPDYRTRDGRQIGPPMFSTYMNQHLWNEPYERKGRPRPTNPAHMDFADERPVWQQRGYANEAAYEQARRIAFEEAKASKMGLH